RSALELCVVLYRSCPPTRASCFPYTTLFRSIGMDRDGLLQDRAKRRKHGLPPELRPAKLEDEAANEFHYLRRDSDWVTAELTLRSEEHTSELQSRENLVCRLRLEKKKANLRH